MDYNKVDFEEIKNTAAEINEVKNYMRKSMGLFRGGHIFLIIMPLVGLGLGAYYQSNHANILGYDYVGFFAFLIATYIIFLVRKSIYISIYRKKLPVNAPDSVSESIWKLFVTENRKIDRFEVMVYKERVLLQKGETIPGVVYENLGYLESENSDEYDFYKKAYALKADAIVNFSTNISHSTKVKIDKSEVNSTTHQHRHISGNAIKIISEDSTSKNSIGIGTELEKLSKLKTDGHITEEEFISAKKHLIENLAN